MLYVLLRWGNGLEYDQNEPRQRLCNWLDKAGGCTLFDFVTKGIISEAVKNCEYWRLRDSQGKQPGLVGYWPSRAVTFLDNHDTGADPRSPHVMRVRCQAGMSAEQHQVSLLNELLTSNDSL